MHEHVYGSVRLAKNLSSFDLLSEGESLSFIRLIQQPDEFICSDMKTMWTAEMFDKAVFRLVFKYCQIPLDIGYSCI